jgi:hypothetical protein
LGARIEVVEDGTALRIILTGQVSEVALPDPVRAFLDAFRDGHYPTLETR